MTKSLNYESAGYPSASTQAKDHQIKIHIEQPAVKDVCPSIDRSRIESGSGIPAMHWISNRNIDFFLRRVIITETACLYVSQHRREQCLESAHATLPTRYVQSAILLSD